MRFLTLALLAALAVSLGACGTEDDRDQATAVVERFYAAVGSEDGEGACEELSAAAVSQLESQSGQDCREVVTRLELDGDRPVRRAQVYVTSAKVDVLGGESAFLDREPGGWKLTAIGCKAEEGKPASRPLECELEV